MLPEGRPPPRGSRGAAPNKISGGQKKRKGSETLKGVDGGGDVLASQGAQQSDRTEKVTVNEGESVSDDANQPLQGEGRMRRGFRRVLTSVSGMGCCLRLFIFDSFPAA